MINLKWKVAVPTRRKKKKLNTIIQCRMLYIISNKKFTFKTSHIYKHMSRFKLHVNTVILSLKCI